MAQSAWSRSQPEAVGSRQCVAKLLWSFVFIQRLDYKHGVPTGLDNCLLPTVSCLLPTASCSFPARFWEPESRNRTSARGALSAVRLQISAPQRLLPRHLRHTD